MKPGYHIEFHHSAGKLHISLFGEFNGMCAWALLKTIKRESAGSSRIFVNTTGLTGTPPDGADLFKSHIAREPLPPDWLYLKGEKGFKIAPDGSRVIVCNKRCGRRPLNGTETGRMNRMARFRKKR